jgi:Rrf2 family protein
MLVALAKLPAGTVAGSGDLAVRLGLPRRFGEQQMTALAKTGLIDARRGTGGGCSLARPASEITVLDVVEAVQGRALDVPLSTGSATAEFWAGAAGALEDWLRSASLADLVRRQAEMDAASGPMYFI